MDLEFQLLVTYHSSQGGANLIFHSGFVEPREICKSDGSIVADIDPVFPVAQPSIPFESLGIERFRQSFRSKRSSRIDTLGPPALVANYLISTWKRLREWSDETDVTPPLSTASRERGLTFPRLPRRRLHNRWRQDPMGHIHPYENWQCSL